MDFAADHGLNWRLRFKEKLEPLGVRCIIPNHEEAELIQDPQAFYALKKSDPDQFNEIMTKVAKKDIGFVHESDFLICRWMGEKMAGSIAEAHEAKHHAHVPVYLVTDQPVENISSWFFNCIEKIFYSEEELFQFLEQTL